MHKENWLFKLANDNSGFLYLSFADVVDSGNKYHGCILNRPTIRESINLAKSTAKTGNISITIPDFQYNGSPISEELFGGSNHYINQTVSVYSNDTSTQIGSFRLIDIATDGNKINLGMTSHRPWDFISIPQTKTSDGVYFPISYGNYQTTSSPAITSAAYCTETKLFPLPIHKIIGGNIRCLLHKQGPTLERVHFYEKNLNQFIPIGLLSGSGHNDTSYYEDTGSAYEGIDAIDCTKTVRRHYKFRPSDVNTDNTFDASGSPQNAFDADWNTYTTQTSNLWDNDIEHLYLRLDVPDMLGTFDEIQMKIKYRMKTGLTQGGSVYIYDNTFGDDRLIDSVSGLKKDETVTTGWVDITSNYEGGDSHFNYVEIHVKHQGTGGLHYHACTSYIYEIEYRGTAKIQWGTEPEASKKQVNDIRQLYTGADGLTESWSGGSADITEIHEAHRDMLIRYTGMTTSIPDGWSSLDTARAGWDIRWWTLKEVDIRKTLEKLQYEGCFIFRYKSDGSPQYIFIPDSPSSSATLTKHDLEDIKVKHTPFSELLTKMEISYKKHPAENKHLSSSTHEDSSSPSVRDNWNILDEENIEQVKLDALVAKIGSTGLTGTPNNGFADYYANIYGDIKIVVSATVINPDYFDLEVGDVVELDDMFPEKAFGEAWSGKDFMVTSTRRTVDKLSIEAREI